MGMYTELRFKAVFLDCTPKEVIDNIGDLSASEVKSDSVFFGSRNVLRGASAYFDESFCKFYNNEDGLYVLDSKANIKNYLGEIQDFINYVKPFVAFGLLKDGAFSSIEYEEDDRPTYLYL